MSQHELPMLCLGSLTYNWKYVPTIWHVLHLSCSKSCFYGMRNTYVTPRIWMAGTVNEGGFRNVVEFVRSGHSEHIKTLKKKATDWAWPKSEVSNMWPGGQLRPLEGSNSVPKPLAVSSFLPRLQLCHHFNSPIRYFPLILRCSCQIQPLEAQRHLSTATTIPI